MRKWFSCWYTIVTPAFHCMGLVPVKRVYRSKSCVKEKYPGSSSLIYQLGPLVCEKYFNHLCITRHITEWSYALQNVTKGSTNSLYCNFPQVIKCVNVSNSPRKTHKLCYATNLIFRLMSKHYTNLMAAFLTTRSIMPIQTRPLRFMSQVDSECNFQKYSYKSMFLFSNVVVEITFLLV